MSQQAVNSPPNPVIALATLPQPQVISCTLGEQGSPIMYSDVRDFPSIMDDNLIENVDYLTSFSLAVSTNIGSPLFRTQTPVKRTRNTNVTDDGTQVLLNWSHLPLLTHLYWDCKQQLGFTFVGPQVIVGKILITYDPTRIYSDDFGTAYRTDRRKITTEWDLSKEKTKWIEVEGFKLDEKRSITSYRRPGKEWPFPDGSGAITVSQWLHGFTYNLGVVELTLIQQIQKVSIYPESYTILVFEANSKSMFYSATDPRRQEIFSCVPYENYVNLFKL